MMVFSEATYKKIRFAGEPGAGAKALLERTERSSDGKWYTDAALNRDEFELTDLVLGGVGVSASCYRPKPFRRRLRPLLRSLRASTLDAALAKVKSDRRCGTHAVDSLLIGHTLGFRDTEVFTTLLEVILPTLLQRRGSRLRVWSLGCSTGEELLSVAWLLARLGLEECAALRGSDCRPSAIEQAQHRGRTFAASVPPPFATEMLSGVEGRFRQLAGQIEWRVEEVLSCPARGEWDLILYRNLSIYLQPEFSARMWRKIKLCMAPGGVLVTGKAERPGGSQAYRRLAKCIYEAEEA